MIQEAVQKLVEGKSLNFEESVAAMTQIMEGNATPAQFGAFVTALRLKGETVDEVAGMATVMREKSLHLSSSYDLVDTCGTGGDNSGTFNISTAAAFVVAGAGVKVAKHGNRAMSGKTGSADVLEALGANIELSPESIAECIAETGFGFMFAQGFHPSMRFAAGPRREIGIRTVFNLLGPLTNPAGANRQLIGVSDPSIGELMANVLARLGCEKALIVHGNDGLDEITLSTTSMIWTLESGIVTKTELSPKEFGFKKSPLSSISAQDPDTSARTIRAVFEGVVGSARDIVLLNSAAALNAANYADSFQSGIEASARSIDSGSALASLNSYVEFSKELQ